MPKMQKKPWCCVPKTMGGNWVQFETEQAHLFPAKSDFDK